MKLTVVHTAPKPFWKRYPFFLPALFLVILAALVFRVAWAPGAVFATSDSNIGWLARTAGALPDAFLGFYYHAPLLGVIFQRPLAAIYAILSIFPARWVANFIYPFWVVVSSLALIAHLRLWGCGWRSALLGSLAAFWVGAITLAAAGHINKPAVMAFFVLSLWLFEKCLRSTKGRRILGYALLCGGATGFMLVEQEDVGLLAALFLGPYMLLRMIQCYGHRWSSWLRAAAPIGIVALLISAGPALRAYQRHVVDVAGDRDQPARSAREQWDFITQWSFPPAEWPDLLAPGYTGWSSGNPAGPYWGVMGQSPEWESTRQGFMNFRLDSLYLGALPLLLALFGWLAAVTKLKQKDQRTVVMVFWGIMALAALWLSMGKFSPLYRLFYQLPLVGNVRAPVKFMHNLQVMVGILAAFGLQCLLTGSGPEREDEVGNAGRKKAHAIPPPASWRAPWWKGVFGGAMALGVLMLLAALSPAYNERFAEWGEYRNTIVSLIRRAWLHGGIMTLLFAAGFFLLGRMRTARWRAVVPLVFIAAVAFDSVYLTSQYFRSEDYAHLRRGNPVINYLKEHQGHERVFLFSTDGVYNRWLAYDFPYHGINAFNVWQMPRMSAANRRFLGTVGQDIQRLLMLSSVRYALAPAPVWQQIRQHEHLQEDFELVMAYRFVLDNQRIEVQPLQQATRDTDQVLLRVRPSLPRMALFSDWETVTARQASERLIAPDVDPLRTVLITEPADARPEATPLQAGNYQPLDDIALTAREARATVTSETGGIVVFTQTYDPSWRVRVNGQPAELLRCNDIAMGVYVPAGGKHDVNFVAPGDIVQFLAQVSGFLMAMVGIFLILLRSVNET